MNKSLLWLAAFIILALLFGVGVIFLVTRPPRGEAVILIPPPTQSPIVVYVNGAVVNEGLYSLPTGSRVNDAIQAAGGFTEFADTYVLNLAKVLEDGEQIVVPEIFSSGVTENETRSSNPPFLLININTATLEQLDSLPGIGPATAQKIIDYRSANGPFKRIEDIQNVPDIGQVTFDKIRELITIGTSP
jgi:competence protein ComEA